MGRECLDWLIPLTEPHLRRILREWVTHYNQGRPHASLGPGIPDPSPELIRLEYLPPAYGLSFAFQRQASCAFSDDADVQTRQSARTRPSSQAESAATC